jgi:2-oxoglutarate ferredoxin oxidoreductase subunit delta
MADKNKIMVYRNWCKRCGICRAFCPKKVLLIDESGYPYLKDAKLCTGCGLCETRCPDFALVLVKGEKPYELIESKEEIPQVSGGGIENAEIPNSPGK